MFTYLDVPSFLAGGLATCVFIFAWMFMVVLYHRREMRRGRG